MRSKLTILIAVVAAFAAIAPIAAAKGTVTTATLSGSAAFPNATGKAVYKVDGTNRELQIEVEHIPALAGQKVRFFVDGQKIGSRTVSTLGKARIARSTEKGQAVPNIVAGSVVTVKTADGTLVASGSF
jgi:hypothetical protein